MCSACLGEMRFFTFISDWIWIYEGGTGQLWSHHMRSTHQIKKLSSNYPSTWMHKNPRFASQHHQTGLRTGMFDYSHKAWVQLAFCALCCALNFLHYVFLYFNIASKKILVNLGPVLMRKETSFSFSKPLPCTNYLAPRGEEVPFFPSHLSYYQKVQDL